MIVLHPTKLHWIKDDGEDDPKDLCAHSCIEFRIGDSELVAPGDGDWSASAAAVCLLRTLSRSHTRRDPVNEHLFPHCGHSMYAIEGNDDVYLEGCNQGVDFEVVHDGDTIVITADNGQTHRVTPEEWRDAVCAFCDEVEAFYTAASPKEPADQFEAQGFEKFRNEWKRRRASAENLT